MNAFNQRLHPQGMGNIYIFIYREGGRERESERETNNRKVLKKRVYIYNIDKRWSTALNPMFTA